MSKKGVTRRQFLNYTLTGVGGFMASATSLPMLRFAGAQLALTDKAGERLRSDR